MINLYDTQTNTLLGQVSEKDLQFMIDHLEEEFLEDQDYSITPLMLGYFQEENASPALMDALTRALGGRDEVLVRWARAAEAG
jgi:hypothetical protein